MLFLDLKKTPLGEIRIPFWRVNMFCVTPGEYIKAKSALHNKVEFCIYAMITCVRYLNFYIYLNLTCGNGKDCGEKSRQIKNKRLK